MTSWGNSVWKKWWQVNPLQHDKQASVPNIASDEDQADVRLMEMPL